MSCRLLRLLVGLSLLLGPLSSDAADPPVGPIPEGDKAAQATPGQDGMPGQENQEEEGQYRSVEERRLLVALKEERSNLQAERDSLEARKKDLKRLEEEVDKKLDEMKAQRQLLEELLKEKDAGEQVRIQNLSKMYEKMPADKAAVVLTSLEQDLAIAILGQMKTKAAAKILGLMDRDKAGKLTAALSNLEQRNKSP